MLACASIACFKVTTMGNLSIRKLDDETIQGLRIKAAKNQVSMEEEARRILRQAVSTPDDLGELVSSLFGSDHGVELELPAHESHQAISFKK